jgi:hypothetical protein
MNFRAQFPAFANFGYFKAIISSKTVSEEYPWNSTFLSIFVQNSQPEILSVQPSTGSVSGNEILTIVLANFPVLVSTQVIRVSFGGTAPLHVTITASDHLNSFLSVRSPPQPPGLTNLMINYTAGPDSADVFTASTVFIFRGHDVDIQCKYGCICGMKAQTAFFELTIPPDRILQIPFLERDCIIDRSNENNSDYCSILSFNLESQERCEYDSSKLCLNISVVYAATSNPDRIAPKSPSSKGFLKFSHSNTNFSFIAVVTFIRAPTLVDVSFSDNFQIIFFVFDQDTAAIPADCSSLLIVDKLGVNPSCSWTEPSKLVVNLGYQASVIPGDILTITANISAAGETSQSTTTQSAVCKPPSLPRLPTISLSGPNSIAPCDDAELYAISTSPRSVFTWGCRNDEWLNLHLANMTNGPRIVISGTHLRFGKVYSITVKSATAFGLISDVNTHDIELSKIPVPLILIELPPPPYFRSRVMFVSASANNSVCSGNQHKLSFHWKIFREDSKLSTKTQIFGITSGGPNLEVQAGTFDVGYFYQIQLIVEHPGQIPIQSFKRIFISYEPITATIAGGNRYVYQDVYLDASSSFDPNQCDYSDGSFQASPKCNLSGVAFSWSCILPDQSLCRYRNGRIATFAKSATLLLDLRLLKSELVHAFQIVVTVSNVMSSSSKGVILIPRSHQVLDLQTVVLYNTKNGLALQSQDSANQQLEYMWTVENSVTGSFLDLSDADTFPSSFEQSNFVLNTDSIWAENNLNRGIIYKITLRIESISGIGIAWFEYKLQFPPSGGTCTVWPNAGLSLITRFTYVCNEWVAESLPLSYRFSVRPTHIIDPRSSEAMWTPASASNVFSSLLPAGNFSVSAMVLDFFGTHAIYSVSNIEVSNDPETGEAFNLEKLDAVITVLAVLSKFSEILLVGDGIASNLMVPPSQVGCDAVGCRRLLGSSTAYRLAVRKLLLQKLSEGGVSAITSVSAPAYLKTVKRITTVPSEIDQNSILLAKNQLILSSKKTKVSDLQSGAFVDVVDLGNSLITSSQPVMSDEPLNALTISLLQAILDVSENYSAAIVPGQKAIDLMTSNIKLNLLVSLMMAPFENISSFESPQNQSRRALAFKPVKLSTCVVRLTRTAPPILSGGQKVSKAGYFAAELVGVRVGNPENIQQGSTDQKSWFCSGSDPGCVQFSVSVSQPNTSQLFSVKCNRWTGIAWSESFCKVGGIQKFAMLSAVKVNCSCDQDGIFKVTVDSFPASTDQSAPIQSLALVNRLHSIQSTIFTGWLALTLVVLALFTIVQTYLRLSAIMDFHCGYSELWSVAFRKIFCPSSDLGSKKFVKNHLQESTFSFKSQDFFQHNESTDQFESSYKLYFSDRHAAQPSIEQDNQAIVCENLIFPMTRLIDQDLISEVGGEKDPHGYAQQEMMFSSMTFFPEYSMFQYEKNPFFRTDLCCWLE